MSPGASNGFLVLRDLIVDALVLDGVEVPDPKSANDPKYPGSFRGYFDVPAGEHTLIGRVSGKEHAVTVAVHPGWATVKRFDMTDGWADDDAETERHYRHLALSGSMQEAGALRPWPLPAPAEAPAGAPRVFGDADLAWLRVAFRETEGACADSPHIRRYIDALRWHYVIDREMGAQAPYFARLGRELADQVSARPELIGTGAAHYLDYFSVDLVDADQPETIAAGGELAAALERARRLVPVAAPKPETEASPATAAKGSPLPLVALAVLLVVGVVFILRRNADAPPQPATTTTTTATTTATGAAVVDLPSARKQLSLFIFEADLAHMADLMEHAGRLETALSKDDCLAARRPFDVIKETKVDLTQHTTLVLSQIRMLTSVATYCNSWSSPDGKRW